MTAPAPTGSEEGEFPWWLVALFILGATIGIVIVFSDLYTQVFWTVAKGLGITVLVTLIAFSLATTLGLGVALLGTIGPALTFLRVSAFWEEALQGAIILAAVAGEGLRRVPVAPRVRRAVAS